MSSDGSSTAPPWPARRRSKRGKMRNGTFIIPRTGERSRRQFTLRIPNSLPTNAAANDEADAGAQSLVMRTRALAQSAKTRAIAFFKWLDTDDGHGVLKCSLAYLLGSCGTFFPPLSGLLGHRDGKHITATLTVYFHASRTVGSMLEAVVIAIVAVLYSMLLCLAAMGVSILLQAKLGLVAPAHAIVLVVFVGGGLGFVGWVKQKLNQPLVNVACTLASISIISILTKEEAIYDGSFNPEKIEQMFKMLAIGITLTVAVNLLLWRVSARRVLRNSTAVATVALGDKLSLITAGFLNGSEEEINSAEYANITGQYDSAYAQMSKTLREAKIEHYVFGHEKIYPLDKRLVKSIETLSQAIGGLRSALETQLTLLRETPAADSHTSGTPAAVSPPPARPHLTRSMSAFVDDARERLAVIDESDEESSGEFRVAHASVSDPTLDGSPLFRAPSDIFELFIALLGPSMKSLAYTLAEMLREPLFGEGETTSHEQLQQSRREALNLYNQARGSALHELYRSIELGRSRSEKIQADIEEVAASCGHFSFSLQAVAEEMGAYLDVLDDLKITTETTTRSWGWLMFWKRWKGTKKLGPQMIDDPERVALLQKPPPVKRLKNSAVPKGIPDTMIRRRDTFNWEAAPQHSKFMRRASEILLKALRFLARDDILFGIKVGIGAILWAQFAFIPSTRDFYKRWRGEWGLLSFMIVVAMTTGAANTTGNARFLGTLIGAACACASWVVCMDNPIALAFVGWLIALWNFHTILVVKNAPLGRITLLAYNVITLYAYSLSQDVDDDDDDEGGSNPLIFDITYHRVIAVTLGILWGIMVCRLLWPISGRRKFREGLSVLYLQLGLIWKRGPLGVLVQSSQPTDYMREGEQAALQRYAFKLESLRDSSKSEFELRGPFPHEAYGRIMRSTKHILDGFYAMRLLTQKRHVLSAGERAVFEYTVAERALLCRRICHVFQVLASCLMLEYPLTDAISAADDGDSGKDRLLNRVYRFRAEHMHDADLGAEEKDYALLYAYTLVTAQVEGELRKVRWEIEGLFGVLNEEALLLE